MTTIKVHCPNCKRYLCETNGTLIAQNVKCGGCKQKVNIKVVNNDNDDDVRHKFDIIEE